MTFHITQNDTLPPFEAEVVDASSQARSLVGATVRFHMWDAQTKEVKVDKPAEVFDASARVVVYRWQQGARRKIPVTIHPEIS